MISRAKSFSELSDAAVECRLCPRMKNCRAVLGTANGSLNSKIVFIAEAPGRFGAGKTGVPFQGDRSGNNFETLISAAGLTRDEVFITNAVLCLPLKDGNNSKPISSEINNCLGFLQATLELIRPCVVVTLGSVALEALNRIFKTRYKLSEIIACPQKLPGFTLLPLYHPSPRVIYTRRSISKQKGDFKKIPALL